jgi:hypothetical protein
MEEMTVGQLQILLHDVDPNRKIRFNLSRLTEGEKAAECSKTVFVDVGSFDVVSFDIGSGT